MPQIDLSPVAVLTAAAAAVFSPAAADLLGPYLVILLGAIGGAAVALLQGEETRGRGKALLFFAGAAGMALLLTVGIANIVVAYFDAIPAHWLFAPVAIGLGYMGDKWGWLLRWCGKKINMLVDVLIQLRGQK